MQIVKPRILQKNEQMNLFLLKCDVFSFVFLKNPRLEKKRFEIIWPLLNKNFLPKNLMPLTKVSKIKRRFLPCTILGNFCGQDLGLYFWFFFHRKLIYFWMELQNCNIRSFFHSISVLAFNFSVKMSLFIFFNEWKIIIPFCQGWPRIGASIKSFDWDSWMPAKFSNKTQCVKNHFRQTWFHLFSSQKVNEGQGFMI